LPVVAGFAFGARTSAYINAGITLNGKSASMPRLEMKTPPD
jgi:hypothetical protein